MALSNAERQAAHRAKQESTVAELATTVSKLFAENDALKQELEASKVKLINQETASKKKIVALEKKLLSALEKAAGLNVKVVKQAK